MRWPVTACCVLALLVTAGDTTRAQPVPPHLPARPEVLANTFIQGLFPRHVRQIDKVTWRLETRAPRNDAKGITWTKDNEQIVYTTSDGGARFYDTKSWQLDHMLVLQDRPTHVAWSPDGKHVASVDSDTHRLLIATEKGELRWEDRGAKFGAITWSDDGQWLAAIVNDRSLAVWNAAGTLRFTLRSAHHETIKVLSWCSDNKRLATASRDGVVRIWTMLPLPDGADPRREDPRGSRPHVPSHSAGNQGVVRSLAWHPDGNLLAVGNEGGVLTYLDGAARVAASFQQRGTVYAVAWSPDGKHLASTDGSNVLLRDAQGAVTQTLEGPIHGRHLAWSQDSQRLASSGYEPKLHVWELDGESGIVVEGEYPQSMQRPVLWSSNGGQLLTYENRDLTLRFWDTTGIPTGGWDTGGGQQLWFVAWRPDQKELVTYAFGDRQIRWWKPDGTSVRNTPRVMGEPRYSPDGTRLVVTRQKETVWIFDAKGKLIKELQLGKADGQHIWWSPDSQWFASAGTSGKSPLRLISADGDLGPILAKPGAMIADVSWHPSGKRLAAIDLSGQVNEWDLTGKRVRKGAQHEQQGGAIAWSPNGKWLASSSNVVHITPGHGDGVARMSKEHAINSRIGWNADSTWLACQEQRFAIQLWDPMGKEGRRLIGRKLAYDSATWSPDGRHIACTTNHRTVLVWDSSTGAARWVGLWLPDKQSAVVTAEGKVVTAAPDAFDAHYVFLTLAPNGDTEMYSLDAFREQIAAGGRGSY